MVEDGTSDDNTTTNKGVNVHSESLPIGVHRNLDTDTSCSSVPRSNRSMTDIKNEIQHVLDLMGPSTPNLTSAQNTSSDADNEESVMSIQKPKPHRTSTITERERSSRTTGSPPNKDSVLADVGSLSSIHNCDSLEMERVTYDPSFCCHDCIHMMRYMQQSTVPVPQPITCDGYFSTPKTSKMTVDCKKPGLIDWLKTRPFELRLKKSTCTDPCELYRLNICGQEDDNPPKRVVFDLVDGIPRKSSTTVGTNTIRNPVEKVKTNTRTLPDPGCPDKEDKNAKNEEITHRKLTDPTQKGIYRDGDGDTRVDFYYFDHGNSQYFHTTDTPPVMVCEILAEKTERYTTKFWAEFFATVHIGVSFFVSFILQLFKFLLYSIIRPLTVGLMQLWSDYLFKPFLTTLFNGIIQPYLIFLYNIATSLRDLCDPIAEAFGYFCRELAVLFRAIRLCTYKRNVNDASEACGCDKKYKCVC